MPFMDHILSVLLNLQPLFLKTGSVLDIFSIERLSALKGLKLCRKSFGRSCQLHGGKLCHFGFELTNMLKTTQMIYTTVMYL